MDDWAGCSASVLVATTTASQKKQKIVTTGGAFCGVDMRIVIMTVKGCQSCEICLFSLNVGPSETLLHRVIRVIRTRVCISPQCHAVRGKQKNYKNNKNKIKIS